MGNITKFKPSLKQVLEMTDGDYAEYASFKPEEAEKYREAIRLAEELFGSENIWSEDISEPLCAHGLSVRINKLPKTKEDLDKYKRLLSLPDEIDGQQDAGKNISFDLMMVFHLY